MSGYDHLVLLGAAYHVPKHGASIEQIAEVVSEAGGGPLPPVELLAAPARLIAAGHIEPTGDRYRASSAAVNWFGRTHRCNSGMHADAENLRDYLAKEGEI